MNAVQHAKRDPADEKRARKWENPLGKADGCYMYEKRRVALNMLNFYFCNKFILEKKPNLLNYSWSSFKNSKNENSSKIYISNNVFLLSFYKILLSFVQL